MNYLQNQWGPDTDGIYDFSSKGRSDFEMFLSNHGPDKLPIDFNLEIATASQLRRNSNSHNNSTTSEPPRSISMSSYPTNRILYNWEEGRRPISDYPTTLSRTAAGFLDWDRRLHALGACSHKTNLVLDKDYSPIPGSDEDELFLKTHMWAVFVEKIKDPTGSSMVDEFDTSKDPQALYAALLNLKHYTDSQQAAVLRANTLRGEIVGTRILATRAHSLTQYILSFYSKIHEYNKMVPDCNKMDEADQLIHFKNYMKSVKELVEQTTTAIDVITAEKALSPEVETLMYKNYAVRIDEAASTNLPRGNRRQVFESE